MDTTRSAAVIGLGIIGSNAVHRLTAARWNIGCWNRTPKAGMECAAHPEEAVSGAEFISFYLKDALAVRQVFDRIKPHLNAGQLLLNHSTIDLETTLWLAEEASKAGCAFLDAPFTGSKVASSNGQLVYYIGGDPDLAGRVEAYLRITGKSYILCGEVGAATVVKLATNLISACTVQALSEAMAIATRHGVPAELFTRAVSENACSSVLSGMKLPTMAQGDFETHFSLSNMAKDSRYALALAGLADLETPAIKAVSARMGELCDAGLGELDYSALAKPYLPES